MAQLLGDAEGARDQEYYDKIGVRSENLIAECMTAEGFEYLPRDLTGTVTVATDEDLADQNTEAWVATNGYGISTAMDTVRESAQSAAAVTAPLSTRSTPKKMPSTRA
ncbi:hypothetical protein [Sanguibacter gelidistatuariae]|uniref:hypothetical protein n=1 Tax=Sanguibacter gelidistatuariae TaxID=1814289 RepID=UPI0011137762|nr:hypothetical protein [Sanguibacter gelidistatuariae]